MSHGDHPTFLLNIFGNVGYTTAPAPGDHSGFDIGPFDLYATTRLSDHWSALGELVFENDNNELSTDLERFLVAWEPASALRLRVGREHSPLVRWNTALHHGLYMQTPVERPAMARFEDDNGPWPVHFVGVLVSGGLPNGVSYGAGAGNGRGSSREEVQVSFDRNGSKAYVAWLGFAPAAVIGWELFATGHAETIPAPTGPLRERDLTFATNYLAHGVELRAEWGRMNHKPVGSGITYKTTGWYVLLGLGLRGGLESLKPYVLLDSLKVAREEAYLAGIPDRSAWSAGLRWDPNGKTAVKGEYVSQKIGSDPRDSLFRSQIALSF